LAFAEQESDSPLPGISTSQTIPEKRLSIPFFAGRALKMIGWKEAEIDTFLTTDEGKDFVSKLALVEKRDAEVEGDEHEKRLVPWVVGARAGLGILNMAQRIIKSNKETINVSSISGC